MRKKASHRLIIFVLRKANSPFNAYASSPPVVVDQAGNFYGYLTLNTNKKQCQHPVALAIYQYYKVIRKDVAEGYKAIFGY